VTIHLLDVASYQGGLTPADVVRAGFTAVNVKVSHGVGDRSVHPQAAAWVARPLGLGVSTFHYLTGDASGVAQADYAWSRMQALGVPADAAHVCDTEEAASWETISDYLMTMRALTGRPVGLYTGDWWWQAAGRRWDASGLAGHLWASPNAGYLSAYPGDGSPHWTAGYAGFPALSVMQYAVGPLRYPDGTRGSINVSMSAIRDPTVWADLTTRRTNMTNAPQSILNARAVVRRETGLSAVETGIVGDDNHTNSGSSYHLGKSALRADSYTITESSRDRNGLSEYASALDIGWFSISRGGKTHTLRTFSAWLVNQCKAGTADTADIREIIYSPDGKVVKRWDRLGKRSTGDDSHLTHTHVSWFRDSTGRDNKAALFERYFAEIEGDDVSQADVIAALKSPEGRFAIGQALTVWDPGVDAEGKVIWGGVPNPDPNPANVAANPTISPAHAFYCAIKVRYELSALASTVNALTTSVAAIAKNVTADDGDLAAITAQLTAAQQATADLVIAGLTEAGRSNEDVVASLRAAFGAERAAVIGALLSGE
jgi:hypothetical protein